VFEVGEKLPTGGGTSAAFDTVHNYRNTIRDVEFRAPFGLKKGQSLIDTHHGYDNLFIDVVVDNVVFDGGSSGNWTLLDWHDHGSGSQFVRVSFGSNISVKGPLPATLNVTFIDVWGYCGTNFTNKVGLSAIRNVQITDIDLGPLATGPTTAIGFKMGCYLTTEALSSLMLANNTFANIDATNVTGVILSHKEGVTAMIANNIFGPFAGQASVGLNTPVAADLSYTNLDGVNQWLKNKAVEGPGCIDGDSMFVDAAGGDYHLKAASPCTDTGVPFLKDPDGSPSDMGAFGGPLAK
jgi:hypothetical protein